MTHVVDVTGTTSLETQRLNEQWQLQHQSKYERMRHEGDQGEREAVVRALSETAAPSKAIAKFCSCGANATVWRHRLFHGRTRVRCNKCDHRLCPACSRERGYVLQTNLQALAESAGKKLSMITLTLRHTEMALAPTLSRLIKAFHELRRSLLWKRSVQGGAWVVEIHRGKDGRWHPHIHCLAHAAYIRPSELSAAWLTATGDSTIVDVRRKTAVGGARYVAKYVTKPMSPAVIRDHASLCEMITATRRLRRCATIGTWRGHDLTTLVIVCDMNDPAGVNDPENWEMVCHFSDMLDLAAKGHAESIQLLANLRLRRRKETS